MSQLSFYRILSATALIVSITSAQTVDEAIKLFNAFQFDKAKNLFVKLAQDENNPRIAEIYYYLGRLNVNLDSSFYYYKIIIDRYPQSRYVDVAYLEIGKIFILKEDFSNALITFNELIKNYPNSDLKEEILFWLGFAYIETGNKESGYKTFNELINTYPNSIWASRAKNLLPSNQPKKEFYTVQVGSFRNKNNAETIVSELKAKGFDAKIIEAVVMDKIHYRVWVGEFETMEQAKTLALKLDSLGIKGNVVKGY
ncbi:MAG: tetratricopeptide repeat protein [candidate division WOR-3 bacterium]